MNNEPTSYNGEHETAPKSFKKYISEAFQQRKQIELATLEESEARLALDDGSYTRLKKVQRQQLPRHIAIAQYLRDEYSVAMEFVDEGPENQEKTDADLISICVPDAAANLVEDFKDDYYTENFTEDLGFGEITLLESKALERIDRIQVTDRISQTGLYLKRTIAQIPRLPDTAAVNYEAEMSIRSKMTQMMLYFAKDYDLAPDEFALQKEIFSKYTDNGFLPFSLDEAMEFVRHDADETVKHNSPLAHRFESYAGVGVDPHNDPKKLGRNVIRLYE